MMRLNKQEDIKKSFRPHSVSVFCLFSYFLQLSSIFHFCYDSLLSLTHLDIWLSSRPYFILGCFFSFPCHISIISFSHTFPVLYSCNISVFLLPPWRMSLKLNDACHLPVPSLSVLSSFLFLFPVFILFLALFAPNAFSLLICSTSHN